MGRSAQLSGREQGRARIEEKEEVAAGDYVCLGCGGVVSRLRQVFHDKYYCDAAPSSNSDDEDASGNSNSDDDHTPALPPSVLTSAATAEAAAAAATAATAVAVAPTAAAAAEGGWIHSISPSVSLAGLAKPQPGQPDLPPLSFEQQSLFGELSTGGALWTAELLLGEWCLREFATTVQREQEQEGKKPLSPPPGIPARNRPFRILEVGCGVAPAAGLACLCAGASVLFTDLEALLSYTERNVRRNYGAVVAARAASCNANSSHGITTGSSVEISRSNCDILPLDWADSLPNSEGGGSGSRSGGINDDDDDTGGFSGPLPPRVVALAPFDFIIVADCVWRTSLHKMLAHTLARLLRQGVTPLGRHAEEGSSSKETKTNAAPFARSPAVVPRCILALEVRSVSGELAFFDGALAEVGLRWRDCPAIDDLVHDMAYLGPMPHGTLRVLEVYFEE